MKDFQSKRGSSRRALQCNDNATSRLHLLAARRGTVDAWSGGSNTWVQKDWNFGTVNLTCGQPPAVHQDRGQSDSEDDMWFAYDTAAIPSGLEINMTCEVITP